MLVLILFNSLVLPRIVQVQVTEVDYGTFMSMTAAGNIGRVEVQTNKILFTDKAESPVYKTGLIASMISIL